MIRKTIPPNNKIGLNDVRKLEKYAQGDKGGHLERTTEEKVGKKGARSSMRGKSSKRDRYDKIRHSYKGNFHGKLPTTQKIEEKKLGLQEGPS